MNLSFVTNSPALGQSFTVLRSQGGAFVLGKWTEPAPQTLNYFGVISIADARTVEALPEADRVHEMIVINCEQPLYLTRATGSTAPATSDQVVYQGEKYRVMKVHNYAQRGYWWALASRMAGA